MTFVYLLVALIVLVAVLLVFLVIIQNSKGGGLASNFQSVAAASQIVGVRKAADLVEKLTWYFMAGLVVCTFLVNLGLSGAEAGKPQNGLKMNQQLESQRIQTAPTALPNLKDIPEEPAAGKGKDSKDGKAAQKPAAKPAAK